MQKDKSKTSEIIRFSSYHSFVAIPNKMSLANMSHFRQKIYLEFI